jgi:hypothetical protein
MYFVDYKQNISREFALISFLHLHFYKYVRTFADKHSE